MVSTCVSTFSSFFSSSSPIKSYSPSALSNPAASPPVRYTLATSTRSLLTRTKLLFASSRSSLFLLLIASKSIFGNFCNASVIPCPMLKRNPVIPVINPVNKPTTFFIRFISPPKASSIFGSEVINQPINIIPKKSSILPRKPFVLFAITVPCLLIAPEIPDASSSSSLCFLLTFSCLFLKNKLSRLIIFCLNILFSLVLLTISEAVSLVLRRPFVNFVTEVLIELILIDDFSNEFLLALMSDIIPPH